MLLQVRVYEESSALLKRTLVVPAWAAGAVGASFQTSLSQTFRMEETVAEETLQVLYGGAQHIADWSEPFGYCMLEFLDRIIWDAHAVWEGFVAQNADGGVAIRAAQRLSELYAELARDAMRSGTFFGLPLANPGAAADCIRREVDRISEEARAY